MRVFVDTGFHTPYSEWGLIIFQASSDKVSEERNRRLNDFLKNLFSLRRGTEPMFQEVTLSELSIEPDESIFFSFEEVRYCLTVYFPRNQKHRNYYSSHGYWNSMKNQLRRLESQS